MSYAELLCGLFDRLRADGIAYVVLRNYEGLPECVGHDVDLLLDQVDLAVYRVALQETATALGWRIVRVESRHGFLKCYLYHPGTRFLQIDVFCPEHYHGVPLLRVQDVLDARRNLGRFDVPCAGHEAVSLLFKELLGSGKVKRAYSARILALLRAEPDRFERAVSDMFGSALAGKVKQMCQEQDWDGLEGRVKGLRRALAWHAWRTRPWEQPARLARFVLGHMGSYLRPSGFFVCLVGPDGSGKTSVAEKLAESLDWTLFQGVFYVHSHFAILPELKAIKRAVLRMLRRPVETDASGSRGNVPEAPHPPLRAIGYLLYYTLDYVLGHIVVLRARAKGRLIVCDRYFYDYMIQWTMRLLPKWLTRALATVVPRPDLLIFLENEAEAVYRRKQEIPVHEIRRQLAVCRELAADLGNARIVQTTGSLSDTSQCVIEEMMDRMARRARKQDKDLAPSDKGVHDCAS